MRFGSRLGFLMTFLVSFSVFAAGLGEFLRVGGEAGERALAEVLEKNAIKETTRGEFSEMLRLVLRGAADLGDGAMPATDEALFAAIKKSNRIPEAAKDQVIAILKKDVKSQLVEKDLADVTNTLANAAEGNTVGHALVGCETCVEAQYSRIGIRKWGRLATEGEAKVLSGSPSGKPLNAALIDLAKNKTLALKDFSAGSLAGLTETEKKWLLYAMNVTVKGKPGEQALGKELLKFNLTTDREGFFSNKLWMLLTPSEKFEEVDMERLASALRKINSDPANDTVEKRLAAFDKYLDDAAGDNPVLKAKRSEMNNRRSIYNGRSCVGCFCTKAAA